MSPILGDDELKAKVVGHRDKDIDRPALRRAIKRPTLQDIVKTVCRRFRVDEDVIWYSTRGRGVVSPARSVAMYICQEVGGMGLGEVSDVFGFASYASAGSTIRRVRQRVAEDQILAGDINYILLELTP